MDQYDVVVIGYGPCGQMASLQLGQAGHSVIALERHPQLYGLSRAGHIDDEIMRTLDRVGAGEEFREDAVAWELYDMRNKAFGGELLMSLDWSTIGPHGHRGHWIFYQNNLEMALNHRATSLDNVEVHMNHEVVEIDQDADGVVVTYRDRKTDEERTVRAAYAIAADGDNSFVRSQLGITTTPGNVGPLQLVIDTVQKHELDFAFDNGQFADPERPGCLFQLGKTHRRWEFTLLPGEKAEDFTLDRVWELLEPWVTPEDVEVLRHPVYQFRESMTDEWSRGRIFLVGDAAHILWPFAGEGMCNGLRDASALTWRLDLVLRGLAEPTVLDSYEGDRKPNMQGWTDFSREIGLPCIITDPAAADERDGFLKAVQQDPSLMPPPTIPGGYTAFAREADPLAGAPAVQGQVRVDGRTGLFDDVVGRGFQLIVTDPAVLSGLTDDNRAYLETLGAIVTAVVSSSTDDAGAVVDAEGTYAGWFGEHGRAAVLARPDFWLYGSAADAVDVNALVSDLRAALAGSGSTGAGANGTVVSGAGEPTAAH
ncbi:bifunctional 3-(3-hydroxy-phenyl)propionate/3-hydroxycinnamic acid hydroxylase [Nocardioides plantarum]|uniref:Bifunctional 3-(3-hydroxy-phenyl)propionate/3-hydroxycinnamic acid hydroxylase n=1 Tax=Nocardioides plantarum TaxID=29299 RepID=A0ABV5KDK5_9ACTN|nr:bifunctional 3-(3-hydroxy-phenyl)propionate/3-hydroxycinnamic acid hydroxylase [Nocardioides plantarum]